MNAYTKVCLLIGLRDMKLFCREFHKSSPLPKIATAPDRHGAFPLKPSGCTAKGSDTLSSNTQMKGTTDPSNVCTSSLQ